MGAFFLVETNKIKFKILICVLQAICSKIGNFQFISCLSKRIVVFLTSEDNSFRVIYHFKVN